MKQVITFDSLGITRHPNHTPLSHGVELYLRRHRHTRKTTRLWVLETVIIPMKFTSVLYPAILQASIRLRGSQDLVFVSSLWGYLRTLRAMMQHRSQLVWFRWLYVLASKYMWTDRLVEIPVFGR